MQKHLDISESQQYLMDSALSASSRDSLTAYLSALSSANAKALVAAIDSILPVISARADAISQELKSVGSILSDTTLYAQNFQQEVAELSFVNINTLLTKSANNFVASSTAQQTFLDDNAELMKQYQVKQSLADFYLKYSAHLQDKNQRLSNSLQTLAQVHDNLTIIQTEAQKKL